VKEVRAAAVVIAVLLVALAVVGFGTRGLAASRSRFQVPGAPLGIAGLVLPVVNTSATRTAWYCVTPPASSGVTSSSVVATDVSSHPVKIAIGSQVTHLNKQLELQRYAQRVVFTGAKASSGVVVVSSGGTLVTVRSVTPEGVQSIACQSSTYDSWILPSQDTQLGRSALLSLYNPYPEPAVADITILGSSGSEVVPAGAGIVLEPGRTDVVRVSSLIANTANSSLSVTIRSGRAVVGDVVSRGNWHSLIQPIAVASSFSDVPDVEVGTGIQVAADLTNPTSRSERIKLGVAHYQGAHGTFEVAGHPYSQSVVVGADSSLRVDLTREADAKGAQLIGVTARTRGDGRVVLAVTNVVAAQGSFAVLEGMSEPSRSWWLSCEDAPSHRTMVAFTHIPKVGDLLAVSSHGIGSLRAGNKFLSNILEPGIVTIPVRLSGAVVFHATLASPAFLAPVGFPSSCTGVLGE
jgi:hypothetical protein